MLTPFVPLSNKFTSHTKFLLFERGEGIREGALPPHYFDSPFFSSVLLLFTSSTVIVLLLIGDIGYNY